MKMIWNLEFEMFGNAYWNGNISRIPFKSFPQPWVESFLGLFEGILLFLRNLRFGHENESGIGFDEMWNAY